MTYSEIAISAFFDVERLFYEVMVVVVEVVSRVFFCFKSLFEAIRSCRCGCGHLDPSSL